MVRAKEKVYLTDITLHIRKCRPTISFSKVAQKGRLYSSVSQDEVKGLEVDTTSGSIETRIELPEDLSERINRGEVQLMMPKDGLYIYAGKDLLEYVDKLERDKRKKLTRVWRKKEK